MTKMSKRDFITAVSKHTDIRRDAVEEIFEGMIDVAIAEIVNNGEFSLKDLLTVSSSEWKGYSIAGVEVKPAKRLSVRLSEKLKKLWKLRNEEYAGATDVVTKDNWRDILKYHNKEDIKRKQSKTNSPSQFKLSIPTSEPLKSKDSSNSQSSIDVPKNFVNPFNSKSKVTPPKQSEDWNPLLDDDDEES